MNKKQIMMKLNKFLNDFNYCFINVFIVLYSNILIFKLLLFIKTRIKLVKIKLYENFL